MFEALTRNKKVAFYTGCFANYYEPKVGKATISVLRKNGVEVIMPEQVCCGLPMVAKRNIEGAHKNMEYNTKVLSHLVSEGYALITTCSSCSLMIKREYPRMLDSEKARLISASMFHITEYLLKLMEQGGLNTDLRYIQQTVFYHTPCHLRAQGIGDASLKMLQLIPGTTIKKTSNECCGMGGVYGNEKVNYEFSRAIASKLYSEIKENPTDRIVTDCGGCKLQIEAGTGAKVDHPTILFQEAADLVQIGGIRGSSNANDIYPHSRVWTST